MAETPIPATYVSASSFSVAADRAAEFVAGVRVRADCGADGIKYGTVTSDGAATVTLSVDDSATLTANLVAVLHGNDVPASLCNHGHTGAADGGDLPAYVKADCSVPFTGGHIAAQGAYTGFKFTETGAATNAGKSILQVDGGMVNLLFVDDAETVFESVWNATRNGATPTAMTVTPLLVASGGLETGTINGQDVSGGLLSAVPGAYARDTRLAAKSVISVAADRYTLLTPNRLLVDVGGVYLSLSEQRALVLSDATVWDSTATDYTVAANRAGKDFSVYACLVGGVALKILISANATTPTGYTALTSRRIGGFHCLCASVGTISGHPLTGYVAGDILPASVWDLKHRPVSSPAGMVYVAGIGKWVDIYLPSYSGGVLVSAYGGTIADGTSSPAFHAYKFAQLFGAVGKRMLTPPEFVVASLGSNQGTAIAGGADPVTAGGHNDTAGRRMISNEGVEDGCGALQQWGSGNGGGATSASFANAFDANDSGVAGQHYLAPNNVMLGGSWSDGATCGSRCAVWAYGALSLYSSVSSRGLSEHISGV